MSESLLAEQTIADVAAPVGDLGEADVQVRLESFRLACAAAPLVGTEDQFSQILLAARHIAKFAIEGTTPSLFRDGTNPCA